MATSDSAGVRWYRARIGEPSTADEANGYWLFFLGALLGAAGIGLFTYSAPAGLLREIAIAAAAAGLVLVVAGPIIRLPLRRFATYLTYLGVLICAAAIVWFFTIFPAEWSTTTGHADVILLYAAGLAVVAIGGVFVPILTPPAVEESPESQQMRADLGAAEDDRAGLADQLEALRASQAQFELFEGSSGQWRWRLRHRNGNVIADSGEGYASRRNAQNGLESVRRNALGAPVIRPDVEPVGAAAAEAEAGFVFDEDAPSQADFELYEDDDGRFRWRLVHDNGNVLADSGQGYASRSAAREAIENLKRTAGPADYLRADPTAVELYRDRKGRYRWRLIHRNGQILADGGQGYAARAGARSGIESLQTNVGDAPSIAEGEDFEGPVAIETYEDVGGEHRWRLRHRNGNVLADSGEGYDSRDGLEAAIDRLRGYAADAHVLDVGVATFEVYEDEAEEYRWRLRHRNGRILADSGEGYADRGGAEAGIESVKRNVLEAETAES